MDRLDWFLTRCLFFLICLVAVCALILVPVFERVVSYHNGSCYYVAILDGTGRRLLGVGTCQVSLPGVRFGRLLYFSVGPGDTPERRDRGFLRDDEGRLRAVDVLWPLRRGPTAVPPGRPAP